MDGGALEVVNDDSSVPMPISMKNSRSSWLRCSVASVVIGVVAARLMTGVPTARSATSEFRKNFEIRHQVLAMREFVCIAVVIAHTFVIAQSLIDIRGNT